MVDTNDQLHALWRQEASTYKTHEYLLRLQQQQQASSSSVAGSGDGSASSQGFINQRWRDKICEWAYQVVDHFYLEREIVGIAMNYMDRYLALVPAVDKRLFQLLAMTCVYLSIKLHHFRVLLIPGSSSTMESILNLSRGFFSLDEMKSMEYSILHLLNWHVHPPIPQDFVRIFLSDDGGDDDGDDLEALKRAIFITELAVADCFFVPYKPSVVAMAALAMVKRQQWSPSEKLSSVCFDFDSPEVKACCDRLERTYASIQDDLEQEITDGQAPSPVSVLMNHP